MPPLTSLPPKDIEVPNAGPGTLTRRLFGAGLLGALSLPAVLPPLLSDKQQNVAVPNSLVPFVYDARFRLGRYFGLSADRAGHSTFAVQGDVTSLWTDTLLAQWRTRPASLAGITTPAALFCLEQLAATYRITLAFRIDVQATPTDGAKGAGDQFLRALAFADYRQRLAVALNGLPASTQPNGGADRLVAWIMRPTLSVSGAHS